MLTDEQVLMVSEACRMHGVLKQSHLEANAEIKRLRAANAAWAVNTSWVLRWRCRDDEGEVAADARDRLAVVADALAVEAFGDGDAWDFGWQAFQRYAAEKRWADRLEVALRELVAADAWQQECAEAKEHCFWRRGDYPQGSSKWRRWDRSFHRSADLLSRAKRDQLAASTAARDVLNKEAK